MLSHECLLLTGEDLGTRRRADTLVTAVGQTRSLLLPDAPEASLRTAMPKIMPRRVVAVSCTVPCISAAG